MKRAKKRTPAQQRAIDNLVAGNRARPALPTRDDVRDYLHARMHTAAINLSDRSETDDVQMLLDDFATAVDEFITMAARRVVTFDILAATAEWRQQVSQDA